MPETIHYRYPLVQYQLMRRRPRLLFLEEAIEDARHFFTRPDWDLTMNGRPCQTTVTELKASQYDIGLTPGEFHHYRLFRWQALNTDNFQSYRQTETLAAKVAFLEWAAPQFFHRRGPPPARAFRTGAHRLALFGFCHVQGRPRLHFWPLFPG